MKQLIHLRLVLALLVAATAPAVVSATTFFTDNFSNGSTTNLMSNPGGTPTASFTSYDIASQKNTFPTATPPTNGVTIYPGGLNLRLQALTTSGWHEAQALFTTNAVTLTAVGDYIDLQIVFTNSSFMPTNINGTLLAAGTSSFIALGLFNSGAQVGITNPPLAGGLAQSGLSTAPSNPLAVGNCANWFGYVGQIYSNGTSRIITRPVQNGAGTTSANQDLIALGAGSGAWNNPNGTNVVSAPANTSVILAGNGTYTMELNIYLSAINGVTNVLALTNTLYSGVGTAGSVVYKLATNNIPSISTSFDGLSFGAAARGLTFNPCMDVSLVQVTGIASPPVAPVIGSQPGPVLVATNGSCAFFVGATGNSLTYQWKRNGTNLLNQGNISGVNSSALIISPAGTTDALTTNNGYYVTVSGAGNLSVNSITNSLTLIPVTNLFYATGAWDVETSFSWDTSDTGNPNFVFDFGDPATFGDNGGGTVTLSGSYLSASSVTVSQSAAFLTWQGSGSFAGPGSLLYNGSATFTVNNANTYTGGTIISNASANLKLGNASGLGTGPITMAMAGGKMEIVPSGITLASDLNVQDNFTLILDATNSSTGLVLNGNLSGTATKTLTISHNPAQTIGTNATRIRINGTTTVYDANLVLGVSGDTNIVWSPSGGSGSQTYNGVISGPGGYLQKLATSYLNNSLNTYSGGTIPAAGAIGLGANSVGSPTVTSGPIGTGPLLLLNDSTTSFNTSAAVFASGGARTVANLIQYAKGTNNLSLIFAGTNDLTLSGAFSLQGNDGGGAGGTNRTIQVTNTGASTLSGVISDGGLGIGLIKTGPGSLYLNNNNTYSGLTTVNNGTTNGLGLLAGSGTIAGSVFVFSQTNSAIGGGTATAIGTLHITGNLTNNGNVFVRLNKSLSPAQSNDMVSVTGVITNTGIGTVIVSNSGPAIAIGDKIFLFNKAMSNGAAMSVTGGNVSWVNNLAVDGSITAADPADVSAQINAPSSVAVGANISYTLTFSNAGAGIATGVAATDTLLSTNVTFVSASNGGVTNAPNLRLVTWPAFTLAANTFTNFTVTVNVASLGTGSVTNITSVATSSFDPNSANNSATSIVSITSTIIPTIPARISSFSIVGANVVINGTNGVNGGTYYLLDSTNAALPFLQWLSAATNVVSASGGSASFTFTGTNVVTPNGAQQFYILSNTNNH